MNNKTATPFTTTKASGLIVSVPEGKFGVFVHFGALWTDSRYPGTFRKKLPKGEWIILGLSHELTEQEADKILPKDEHGFYPDYSERSKNDRHGGFGYTSSIASLHSFLLSLGLDPKENYAILINDKK